MNATGGYESTPPPITTGDVDNADLLMSCKEFFIKRVRCLENFRQKLNVDAKVSSSTWSHPPPSTKDEDSSNNDNNNNNNNNNSSLNNGNLRMSDSLIRLKTDMISLMESDIALIGQLITLSEAVDEFKRQTLPYLSNNIPLSSGSSSMMSLNLDDDDDDDDDAVDEDVDVDEGVEQRLSDRSPLRQANNRRMPLIEDHFETEDEDDVLESFDIPRRRYFARQSSILRIPIGPGSRRRAKSYVECVAEENNNNNNNNNNDDLIIQEQNENGLHQREKPRAMIVKRQSLPTFGSSQTSSYCRSLPHSPTSDSGVSVESSRSTTFCDGRSSGRRPEQLPVATSSAICGQDDDGESPSSCCYGIKPSASHDSQCSFDSGIHLVSPSVDDKEIVNV